MPEMLKGTVLGIALGLEPGIVFEKTSDITSNMSMSMIHVIVLLDLDLS